MTDLELAALSEEPLRGGRLSGAVRVGDTVRRPSRPWSSGTEALLSHLADTGFTQAPRYLGRDERGRDVLSYLPGDTLGEPDTWPAWVWSPDLLADIGGWLRRLHDATAQWQPPDTATWFTGRAWSPGLVIGHHDAAPWNAVVADGRLAGFVDWDTAAPAHPELDLAWTALTWVPLLREDAVTSWHCPATPDRTRRFHLLLDSYGYSGERTAFAQRVAHCARTYAGVIHATLRPGDSATATMLAWADDLTASADAVAALPVEFWQAPSSGRA